MGRLLLIFSPLAVLVALVLTFATMIDRDPGTLPSVLLNKPAPEFSLPPVAGIALPGFDTNALKGEVTLVNVFASWCIPCRDEHPQLLEIKRLTGARLFGINQRDDPANAGAFLTELGNPYDAVGADANGRASIEWGVYGVPETFIVDAEGIVRLKQIGPISPRILTETILPAILAASAPSN